MTMRAVLHILADVAALAATVATIAALLCGADALSLIIRSL